MECKGFGFRVGSAGEKPTPRPCGWGHRILLLYRMYVCCTILFFLQSCLVYGLVTAGQSLPFYVDDFVVECSDKCVVTYVRENTDTTAVSNVPYCFYCMLTACRAIMAQK